MLAIKKHMRVPELGKIFFENETKSFEFQIDNEPVLTINKDAVVASSVDIATVKEVAISTNSGPNLSR